MTLSREQNPLARLGFFLSVPLFPFDGGKSLELQTSRYRKWFYKAVLTHLRGRGFGLEEVSHIGGIVTCLQEEAQRAKQVSLLLSLEELKPLHLFQKY